MPGNIEQVGSIIGSTLGYNFLTNKDKYFLMYTLNTIGLLYRESKLTEFLQEVGKLL